MVHKEEVSLSGHYDIQRVREGVRVEGHNENRLTCIHLDYKTNLLFSTLAYSAIDQVDLRGY